MTAEARPRLLVLASTYPRWAGDHEPGFVHELSKRLTDSYDVTVLCPHASGAAASERLDGVQVTRYRYAPSRLERLVNDGGIVTNLRRHRWMALLLPGFFLAQFIYTSLFLLRHKPAAIHAHWIIPQALVAVLANRLTGRHIPILVTSHGADLFALNGGLMRWLKAWTLRHCTQATVVSHAMLEPLQTLGMPAEKITVAPMGVDMAHSYTPDQSVQRTRRKILFVGRLVEKKGLIHLLAAMPQVLAQLPDASLVVVGFGPGQAEAHAMVESLSLQTAVHFLGATPQSQLPGLYRSSALFVAPFVRATSGDEEGLGLVLVEAIACGCPIIAGNVPALVDVLGENNMDMTIDPRDQAALADRIVAVLMDPELAGNRAEGLRRDLGKRLDWSVVADGYSRILGRVAEGH